MVIAQDPKFELLTVEGRRDLEYKGFIMGICYSRRRLVSAFRRTRAYLLATLFAAGCFSLITASPRAAASPASPAAPSRDDKSQAAHVTKLHLRVLDDQGKPVGNASVYVRFYTESGLRHRDKLAELDLKTNQDGTVKVPPIPQGKILIQVIATGWHTFGKWYDVEQDEDSIEIQLEAPPHWY
jgi:hypothetical protein